MYVSDVQIRNIELEDIFHSDGCVCVSQVGDKKWFVMCNNVLRPKHDQT